MDTKSTRPQVTKETQPPSASSEYDTVSANSDMFTQRHCVKWQRNLHEEEEEEKEEEEDEEEDKEEEDEEEEEEGGGGGGGRQWEIWYYSFSEMLSLFGDSKAKAAILKREERREEEEDKDSEAKCQMYDPDMQGFKRASSQLCNEKVRSDCPWTIQLFVSYTLANFITLHTCSCQECVPVYIYCFIYR